MGKKEKKQKKEKKTRKPSYLKEVISEMKKVTFPKKKEILKYTIATIIIVIFLMCFFLLMAALLSWVKGVL